MCIRDSACAQRQAHGAGERIEALALAVRADEQIRFVLDLFLRQLALDLAFRLGFALGADLKQGAKTLASRTPPVRRIEGEEARLQLVEGTARAGTKELRAVDRFVVARVCLLYTSRCV